MILLSKARPIFTSSVKITWNIMEREQIKEQF